jgi:uncharacterized membrane protein
MEILYLIFLLLGVGYLIAPIVGVVMAISTRDRLRRLELRVAELQRAAASGAGGAAGAGAQPRTEPYEPLPERPGPTQASPYEPTWPAAGEPIPKTAPPPQVEPLWVPGRAVPIVPPRAPEATVDAATEPEPQTEAAEPPPPPTEPPPPPPPGPAPQEHIAGLEERFGTRWVVWVGGVALALGGIFLVKYTIEAGLIGPRLRIFLGALLAAALVAAGEWTRRKEQLSGFAGLPTAHIPSILTAAGTTVAYATAYAAYALYEFLGPGSAFLLLGIVALATLAAALLHGPMLAGLGLVGAYVTPILIATPTPNYWALTIYLAVVSAAAFGLARMRMWRWLALTAIIFSVLWMLPGLNDARVEWITPHAFHAVVGFALVAALIVSGFLFGPDTEPGRIDGVSSFALAAYLFAAGVLVLASRHDGAALIAFAVLTAATVAIAWRTETATAAVPIAALFAAFIIGQWALDIRYEQLIAPGGPPGVARAPWSVDVTPHLVLGALFAALFGVAGFFAQGRSNNATISILWSASAVLAPIIILIALYYRITNFERSIPFAGLALLLAALFGIATEVLAKRDPRPGLAAAGALFATGTIAALALALTFALEKGWLTVALALMVPGVVWVSEQRPFPLLRPIAAALTALVVLRIGWEPRIVGKDIGTTPILNWLLYGYGVPAAAFWFAGHRLRARADDAPTRIVEAAAILFTVLLVFVQIRHLVNGGDIYRSSAPLAELALQVCSGLAMTIGLEWVRGRTHSIIHNVGALVIAGLTLMGIVLGLGINRNPMVTGEPVGRPFFNLILLGYGLPAVLAIALALYARGVRPMGYRVIAAATSVGLALAYLSLEVRRFFHGPVLTVGPFTDAEGYTYSAVWLAFGVVLLIAGIFLRSQPARIASALVTTLTILKVFLVDMHGLTGIYRALSFIGLGLVLMGIGWLYQRLLFPRRPPAATPPPAAEPAPAG